MVKFAHATILRQSCKTGKQYLECGMWNSECGSKKPGIRGQESEDRDWGNWLVFVSTCAFRIIFHLPISEFRLLPLSYSVCTIHFASKSPQPISSSSKWAPACSHERVARSMRSGLPPSRTASELSRPLPGRRRSTLRCSRSWVPGTSSSRRRSGSCRGARRPARSRGGPVAAGAAQRHGRLARRGRGRGRGNMSGGSASRVSRRATERGPSGPVLRTESGQG